MWDLDDFLVNQVGHPYQGNNYFTAGRANGLSFWESAGITAFGSGTWEIFGETNHASLNDLVNTTLGGIALGEMFHRAAWLVRDTRATGRGRLMEGDRRHCHRSRDWRQAVPDGRLVSRVGEAGRDGAVRACRRGIGRRALARLQHQRLRLSGEAILRSCAVMYGDPTTGRSRTAYDAFGVRLRFGGGGTFSEAKVRGRLLGQPSRTTASS